MIDHVSALQVNLVQPKAVLPSHQCKCWVLVLLASKSSVTWGICPTLCSALCMWIILSGCLVHVCFMETYLCVWWEHFSEGKNIEELLGDIGGFPYETNKNYPMQKLMALLNLQRLSILLKSILQLSQHYPIQAKIFSALLEEQITMS